MVNKSKSKHSTSRLIMELDGNVFLRVEKDKTNQIKTDIDVQRRLNYGWLIPLFIYSYVL